MRRHAHKLRGIAGSYGYPLLGELSATLETMARDTAPPNEEVVARARDLASAVREAAAPQSGVVAKKSAEAPVAPAMPAAEVLKKQLSTVPSMDGLELASQVSTKTPYYIGEETAPIRIAVMDYGVKKNILRCLAARGCYLKIFPAKTSFEEVKSWNPD